MVHTLAAPGGPPWRQKKTKPWFLEPPGTHKARRHASQGAPRDPQGAKTIIFLKRQPPPAAPLKPTLKKHRFLRTIKKHKEYHCFCIEHSPWDRQMRCPGPSLDPLISRTRFPGPPRGLLWAKHGPPGLPQGLPRAKHEPPGHPKGSPIRPPSTSGDL